ncbi:MAG TPA: hypothetical protein VGS41_01010 [Chthonomonadales bacterium]|nr:hypothetical protein [Chthonomonadales bacterium]
MQFVDLRNRATLLASFEGWTDVSPSPNWSILVNQAYVEFAWDAEIAIGSGTIAAVSGELEYVIGGNWKAFLDVSYGGAGLQRSSEEYERYANPNWRNLAAGAPARWAQTNFDTLAIIPPPNGTLSIAYRGITEPAALVNDTDVPVGPDRFHEAIALRAAYLQGSVFAQGQAIARLDSFQQRYQEFVVKCKLDVQQGFRRRRPDEP